VLTIPAATAWVLLARTTATAIGARANLPIDRLDDLALAVDEASALLLAATRPGEQITLRFHATTDHGIQVALSAPSVAAPPPSTSFAWLVLTALVDEVVATTDGEHLSLVLRLDPTKVPA
jgi:serine/threonine-protein kinase RsbW